MELYDQNGDECQMTGLPHMFYDKVAVDERIAELEARLRKGCCSWPECKCPGSPGRNTDKASGDTNG